MLAWRAGISRASPLDPSTNSGCPFLTLTTSPFVPVVHSTFVEVPRRTIAADVGVATIEGQKAESWTTSCFAADVIGRVSQVVGNEGSQGGQGLQLLLQLQLAIGLFLLRFGIKSNGYFFGFAFIGSDNFSR